MNPPTPWKLLPLNPPSLSEFPMIFRGGWGGGWLFSGTTQWRWMMEVDESEWGWIKVDESDWRWIGGWRWMKMDEDEWHWMKTDEGGWLWMKVKPWYNEGPRARLSLRFQVTRYSLLCLTLLHCFSCNVDWLSPTVVQAKSWQNHGGEGSCTFL